MLEQNNAPVGSAENPHPTPGQPPMPGAPTPAPQPAPQPAPTPDPQPQPTPAPTEQPAPQGNGLESPVDPDVDAVNAEYDGSDDSPSMAFSVNILKEGKFNVQAFQDQFVSDGGKFHPVVRQQLVAKLGEQKTAFVEHTWTEAYNAEATRATENRAALIKLVGGEESWGHLQNWAKANLTADEAKAYRQALGNPVLREMAVADLHRRFTSSGSTAPAPGGIPRPQAAAAPNNGLKPISRAEYSAEYAKANRAGDRVKMAELDQRRRAAMQAGM